MKLVSLVRAEFARIASIRMGIVTLVALMIVPLVYGGLYLWGNKDPYANLSRVPAAIVVADTGATLNGRAVDYGRTAADTLLADQRFGWTEVDAATAQAGVTNGTYDFVLTFPASFSTDLVSASAAANGSGSPVAAALQLTTNDTNSYLSTTLAKQAAETVRSAIAGQLGQAASQTLLDAVAQIRTGMSDAASGAATLDSGAHSVATGAADAASGAASAASGAQQLAAGTAQLSTGAASLSSGLSQLKDQTAGLPGQTAQLAAGARQVATGAQQLAAAGASLAQTKAQLVAALTAAGVPAEQQAALLAKLDGATSGLSALATGSAQVAAGAQQLATAAPALSNGIAQASAGASSLSTGASSAASGAARLSSGAQQLATGTRQLADGSAQVASGADSLQSGLNNGLSSIPATTGAQRTAAASAIGDPLAVQQTAITQAQDYGAGLAPLFLSLSAWIGIYALFLLVRPLSRRAVTVGRSPLRTTLAGWLTPTLLGAIQMVALFLVTTLAIGLQPANALGLLAFLIVVSATFAAIVFALNVLLGSVGQFLGLIAMLVQLVVAGGTFPWQTLPGPLAALHQALPMTHAVDGIRQLLYGGTFSAFAGAAWPLLVWLVGALLVAALGTARMSRTRTLRDLRPSALGA